MKYLFYCVTSVIFFLNSSCIDSEYKKIELLIHANNDFRAKFTYDQYEQFLKIFQDTSFVVFPINEFRKTFNEEKILVGLRHDVDGHPYRALDIARLDKKYNLSSSFFILHSAFYYGKFVNNKMERYPQIFKIIRKIHKMNHEIGIHIDLINFMIDDNINPLAYQQEELNYFRKRGINIYGCSFHGSSLYEKYGVYNYHIFSDFKIIDTLTVNEQKFPLGVYSLKDFGFEYEARHIPYSHYITESHGVFNVGSIADAYNLFNNAKPGDRIIFVTHPVWWGKEEQPIENSDDNF